MKITNVTLGLSAALWIAGCGGSSDTGSGTSAATSSAGAGADQDTSLHGELPTELTIFPNQIWTGYDGMNTYRAPIIVVANKGNVTWTIDDPSIATLDTSSTDPKAQPGGVNLMIVASKPGKTMIHATDGTSTADAVLEVIEYPYAQWEAGKKRYETGPDDMNPACTECHAPGKGPDHTPTELDADTDPQIMNTFVSGLDPEGRPVNYEGDFDNLLKDYDHKWKVTEDEKVGLVAYLRSLKPLHFPEFDAPTTEKEN